MTTLDLQSAVWIRSFVKSDRPEIKDLTEALHALRISLTAGPNGHLCSCGLILFDQPSASLLTTITEESQHGTQRLLAIALEAVELPPEPLWNLIDHGASDVLTLGAPGDCASQIKARLDRWAVVEEALHSPFVQQNLIGTSRRWLQVLREVIEITIFSQASILLVGESGTGKELLAHLVHQLDRQKDKRDLVIVDCTTIVPELAGSEFFGHERGAFTGAVAPRDGAFALANGGTLFLDEISELPLPLQAQLLRVIQERTFKRVGGNEWKQTDFRLICATNKELSVEIERGRFRRDLYYRIATAVCHVPALRERTEDILLLLDHFSRRARPSDRPLRFEPVVTHFLLEREYPGNVRELRQLISRIMLSHPGDGAVTAGDIPPAERNRPDGEIADWCSDAFTTCIYRALCRGVGMREVLRRTRTEAIHLAMKLAGGNKKVAADRLGTTNRTVQMHLARQGRDDP